MINEPVWSGWEPLAGGGCVGYFRGNGIEIPCVLGEDDLNLDPDQLQLTMDCVYENGEDAFYFEAEMRLNIECD